MLVQKQPWAIKKGLQGTYNVFCELDLQTGLTVADYFYTPLLLSYNI